MTRVNAFQGVYFSEAQIVAENEALGALAPLDTLGQDVAPFAAEWLRSVDDMTHVSEFSKIQPPSVLPRAPHEQQRDLSTACEKLQQRGDPASQNLAKVIQTYLQLNREVTFRTG